MNYILKDSTFTGVKNHNKGYTNCRYHIYNTLMQVCTRAYFALSPSFASQGIVNKNNDWSIVHVRQNLTAIDIPPGVMELAKNPG
jgi:hypothetical protein